MEPAAYRERIYDIFAEPGVDVEEKVPRALDVGTEYLDLPIGFLTRIREGTQEIVRATGDHPLIRPGETCPLESAYCRRTIETDGTLAVQDAEAAPSISEAAVRRFDLGTYIGARVVVDDDTYGTVCFADGDGRDAPFTDAEEVFVELIARLVGQAFERRAYERELEARNEQLETEKQRFEGIAETSYDILFRVGLDAEFTYVSSAVERVLGYDPEDLVGRHFAEVMSEGAIEEARAAYEATITGETVENVELAFVDAAGETALLEVNATPLTDDGEVVGAQGVARDITARRERERELHVKNRAMDGADIGIVIADTTRDGDPVIYANGEVSRLTGYAVDEIVGKPLLSLLGDGDGSEPTRRLGERIEANESASIESINEREDGTPFWNRIRVDPIESEAGEVTHYLGFQSDITDEKRTEQLVRLLNRVLRHNLRNDMTVILGYAEVIERVSEGEVAEFAAVIDRTANKLVDLSEQARELEKYARQERDPRRLDASDVIGDVADRYRDRYPEAAIDVRVETDRDICAGGEVERAVSELVGNGLRHNPASDPWVGIEAADSGDWVELGIEDDGPGIDEMEASVIAKGEETALEHGSGLGLWLVNWIVTRYGGSFRIRAGESGGTVATIRLPGVDPDTPIEAATRRPTPLFR